MAKFIDWRIADTFVRALKALGVDAKDEIGRLIAGDEDAELAGVPTKSEDPVAEENMALSDADKQAVTEIVAAAFAGFKSEVETVVAGALKTVEETVAGVKSTVDGVQTAIAAVQTKVDEVATEAAKIQPLTDQVTGIKAEVEKTTEQAATAVQTIQAVKAELKPENSKPEGGSGKIPPAMKGALDQNSDTGDFVFAFDSVARK